MTLKPDSRPSEKLSGLRIIVGLKGHAHFETFWWPIFIIFGIFLKKKSVIVCCLFNSSAHAKCWIHYAQTGHFWPDLSQLDWKIRKNSWKHFYTTVDVLFYWTGSRLSFNTKLMVIEFSNQEIFDDLSARSPFLSEKRGDNEAHF